MAMCTGRPRKISKGKVTSDMLPTVEAYRPAMRPPIAGIKYENISMAGVYIEKL